MGCLNIDTRAMRSQLPQSENVRSVCGCQPFPRWTVLPSDKPRFVEHTVSVEPFHSRHVNATLTAFAYMINVQTDHVVVLSAVAVRCCMSATSALVFVSDRETWPLWSVVCMWAADCIVCAQLSHTATLEYPDWVTGAGDAVFTIFEINSISSHKGRR